MLSQEILKYTGSSSGELGRWEAGAELTIGRVAPRKRRESCLAHESHALVDVEAQQDLEQFVKP